MVLMEIDWPQENFRFCGNLQISCRLFFFNNSSQVQESDIKLYPIIKAFYPYSIAFVYIKKYPYFCPLYISYFVMTL